MRNSKRKHKSNLPVQSGVVKRFFILVIYHLFIGHKYTMIAAISIAPLGYTLLSITDKYCLRENKLLSENTLIIIISSLVWIPVYIQFGLRLMEWLSRCELESDFRTMSNEEKFKLKFLSS